MVIIPVTKSWRINMKQGSGKTMTFLRKNAIYFIIALCIIAISASVIFVLSNNQVSEEIKNPSTLNGTITDDNKVDESQKGDDNSDAGQTGSDKETFEPSEPVITKISFIMPVANATGIDEYCETMAYNSTLSRYSAHLAIDFYAPEGTDVLAVYDGVIESVENSLLNGVTITIDHGDGLKTIYNSLSEADSLLEGMSVKQGEVIGTVSTTNRQEYKAGAHLHFQVMENGSIINPEKYLTFDEK